MARGRLTTLRDTIGVTTIATMIQEEVGQPATDSIPEYLKRTRFGEPPKYDGKDDESAFNAWLSQWLTHFRRLRIVGPDLDADRVDLLGSALEGKASEWYYENVASPYRAQRHWTFEEAVVELYRRFIITDSFQRAELQFHSVRYKTDTGVAGLYQELRRYAQRMLEPPTQSTIRNKFLSCLPRDFEEKLVINRGIEPSMISLDDLYREALQLEESLAALAYRRKTSELTSKSTHVPPPSKEPSRPPTHQRSTNTGLHRHAHRPPARRPIQNSTRSTFVRRPDGQRREFNQNSKPSVAAPRPGNTGPSAAMDRQRCFACNGIGHFQSDPKCPMFGKSKPRFHAQRLVGEEDVDGAEANDEGDEGERPLEDGSPGEEAEPPYSDHEDYEGLYAESVGDADHADAADDEEYELYSGSTRLVLDECSPAHGEGLASAEQQLAEEKILYSFMMATETPTRSMKNAWLYDSRVRRLVEPQDQPQRDPGLQRTLSAEVLINGVPVWALFDSGCTTDSISPAVAYITTADRIDLAQRIGLQLGAKGSRTSINHGTKAMVEVGPIKTRHYFDIVDCDRYDIVLGSPFIISHKIILDMANNRISVAGKHDIPAYTKVDEAEMERTRLERYKGALSRQYRREGRRPSPNA